MTLPGNISENQYISGGAPWCNVIVVGNAHGDSRLIAFRDWTRLIAFHIALIPLRKV